MNVRFARIGLGVWLVSGGVGRAESGDAKRGLANATVFAGPGGATFEPPAGSRAKVHVVPDRATFWKTHGVLKATVQEAKELVTFAGVARADGDPSQWTEERRKSHFMVDGEWFRSGAPPMPAALAEKVRSVVFAGVREWRGRKLCGGFHADVLLRWQGGPLVAATEVLLCFGCSEVKIYGATGSLYGDLAPEQAEQLREWLAPWLPQPGAEGPRAGIPTPPVRR
jgi:hypothetical protein